MSFADAVSREAGWWTTDTLPTFPGVPPLQAANGGLFDTVQGYLPYIFKTERGLFIYREHVQEERIANYGRKEWVHHFVALVRWPFTGAPSGDGSLEEEMQALDSALDAVMTRARGPVGDKTHGGQFVDVGEQGSGLMATVDDPYVAANSRQPLTARVRYVARDEISG